MRNTKIVHQVTLKHMKMNMKRTVISVIGIALMVMLLTTVLVGKDTACRYFVDIASAKKGAYHYAVYNLDKEKLEKLKELDEITEIAITEDLKYSEFEQSAKPEKPFINVRRYSADAFNWTNIKLVDGRLPQNGNEIVISEQAIKDGSTIKIGDTISTSTFRRYFKNNNTSGAFGSRYPVFEVPAGETVEAPYNMFYFVPGTEFGDEFYKTGEEIHKATGFSQEFTVVGIIEVPVFEEPICAWYSAISLVDETTVQSNTFNALLMTDTKKTDSQFMYKIRSIVGDDNYDINDTLLAFSGSSSMDSLNFIVIGAQAFFVVLIALISVMLIYNIFALSYDERAKYLGMLSSVGATGKQKRSSVYFEAFIMLLPALPVGFASGLGAVKIAANTAGPMAEKMFSFDGTGVLNLKPVLAVSPAAVIAVILLSVITVFISALIPAHKISKVGPIESIRGTKKSGKTRTKAKGNPDRLIGRSVAGMLSSRFFKNDKSKSTGIIRAVAIFFLVTVAVYFGTSLVMMMVDYKLGDNGLSITYGYDRNYAMMVIDTGDQMERDELIDMIKNSEGTSDVTTVRFDSWSLKLPTELLSDEYWNADYEIESMFYKPGELSKDEYINEQKRIDLGKTYLSVTALEDEVFNKMAKEVKAVSYGEGEIPCILVKNVAFSTDQIISDRPRDYKYLEVKDPYAFNEGEVIPLYSNAHSRAEAEEYGLDWDKLSHPEVDLDGAPVNFKVIKKVSADDISDYMDGSGERALNIIVPMSVAEYIDKINVQEMETVIFFNCDNEATVKMLLDLSDQLNELGGNLALNQAGSHGAEFREIIAYLIRTVLIVFLTISSAICLLNVYSSISGLMVSRRKQFAVLKSMGSTFSQLLKTEIRESIRMLIAAIAIAFPVTGIICWLLSKTFISQFGFFTISFPWLESAGLIVFIVAAVLLMTFICLRRENKIDIINEIKRESV
ncbi:MAG: ABC transporter permease [Saccharofermentans sp.]|nr:ABC transporter permease [Saccharofermentans sp.]